MRTSVPRMLCDIAREAGLETALVCADAAAAMNLLRPGDLAACRARYRYLYDREQIALLAALVDPHSESPLETRSRLAICRLGLPRPRLQVPIQAADGHFIGRPDFYWPEFGVVGEADGKLKYSGAPYAPQTADPAALYQEKLRQERLEQAGLVVVRWGWGELAEPSRLGSRLTAAFARGRPGDVLAKAS